MTRVNNPVSTGIILKSLPRIWDDLPLWAQLNMILVVVVLAAIRAIDPALIDAALAALRPGARLVINAVTLETQAVLTLRHKAHGGALRLLQVSHAEPVGHMTGWRAAMPVTQWEYEAP